MNINIVNFQTTLLTKNIYLLVNVEMRTPTVARTSASQYQTTLQETWQKFKTLEQRPGMTINLVSKIRDILHKLSLEIKVRIKLMS